MLPPPNPKPSPFFEWTNRVGRQGMLSLDPEGRVLVDVDDDFYSGMMLKSDSVALALAILARASKE